MRGSNFGVVVPLISCLAFAPASDATTLTGDIVVKSNVRGEIVIFLDDSAAGPSNEADNVFVFTPSPPAGATLSAQYNGGFVDFTSTRFKVYNSSSSLMVDVTIDNVSVGSAGLFSANNGLAAVRDYDYAGFGGDVDALDPSDWIGVEMAPRCQSCDSGGEGAGSCSATNGDRSCAVSCKSDYFACCNSTILPKCYCCAG